LEYHSRVPTLIECHAHVLPDAALARFPGATSARYVTAERRVLGRTLEAHGAHGVTHALVSDSFFMESAAEELPSWAPTDRARLYNDHLADLLARHPGRLFGLGCVDPFESEAAGRELVRMVSELRLAGALVNPSDGRRYLDDAACRPLLETAERLGRPLFVHPSRDLPAADHYEDFVLSLIVGRPTQTAVCAARLIFTGVLDRHPRVELLLAQGGGVLPYVAGRLDATWAAYRPGRWHGPDVLSAAPSSYLRRFFADTNRWSFPALELLLKVLGPDRLLVGNDQPPVWFPLGESLALLERLPLSAADREAVRWRTAARLFRLEPQTLVLSPP
jgi:aminocarboxymuconate-semialdehyde decarboxylase